MSTKLKILNVELGDKSYPIYIGRDLKFYGAHVGFGDEYVREKIEEGL